MRLQPVIKWSGSKRKLAPFITSFIPEGGVYFEPFLGGGSVLGALGPRRSVASDQIPELIGIWKMVKKDPASLATHYERNWKKLQELGHQHYYNVRARFNKSRAPEDLLFLSRTCVNGLIRFNKDRDFNNSLHHTRPGIAPDRFRNILHAWSLVVADTNFVAADYEKVLAQARSGDTVYLDPPYIGNRGRYRNEEFDFERLWANLEALDRRNVRWLLSLDGSSGAHNYSKHITRPRELAKVVYTLSGESSAFPRLLKKRLDEVTESLFLNFDVKR
jgi:DNA adenine methylase